MDKNAQLQAGSTVCEFCSEPSTAIIHGTAVCRMHVRDVTFDQETKQASLKVKRRARRCPSLEIDDALDSLAG